MDFLDRLGWSDEDDERRKKKKKAWHAFSHPILFFLVLPKGAMVTPPPTHPPPHTSRSALTKNKKRIPVGSNDKLLFGVQDPIVPGPPARAPPRGRFASSPNWLPNWQH